jgi:ankyrin repeat protein
MTRNDTRAFTPTTSLEQMRKEAKTWLKALRAGDAQARGRLLAAWPGAPAQPGLRDVQHALAREYGLAGWTALKAALADAEARRIGTAEAIEIVLRHAWDGHNGWRADVGPAMRMLRVHPDIVHDNIHIAAMCGELEEVRRRLAADPASGAAKGGPLGFEPLHYLAYGLLDLPAVRDNSVEIARLLIDHGADVNAMINDGWDNPFTVLTGVIGLGEGVKPPHPNAEALADLFIARGADPYDTQALYNSSIVGDDVFWLDFLYSRSEARGETGRWSAPGQAALGGPERSTLDYLLGNAVSHGHARRARWLLARGADPNGVNSYSKRPHHEVAQTRGDAAMARLLEEAGATPLELTGQAAFHAAIARGDRQAVTRMVAEHPGALAHAAPLIAAVGAPEAVRLLLSLGADPNAKDKDGVPPLHWAVHSGPAESAQALIDAGADANFREPRYGATPLGWAVFLKKPDMADLLAPLSVDPFALAEGALTDRLRAVLEEDPTRANARAGQRGDVTPLCCLPDDEDLAAEVAAILLAAGADPGPGRREGLDAEAHARKRGLIDAADLIAEAGQWAG